MSICELFGTLMAPAVKNDLGNVGKVRTAWESLRKPESLRDLFQAEVDSGVHKPARTRGGALTLKDPSAAVALVWVRRSIAFQTSLLDGVQTDRSARSSLPPSPPSPSS